MKIDLYPLFLLFIIALTCLVLLFSCTAKKKTTERIIITDTLRTVSLNYKTEPIQSNYTIDLICDTLTGRIQPVRLTDKSGDNSASLIIENNKLKAKLKVAETESKSEKKEKIREKIREVEVEIIKYRTPLWMWITIIFETIFIIILLYLLFKPKIPFI